LADFAQTWQEELTESETETMIEKIAVEICRRNLQTPAILMLEMNKPWASIAGNASIVAAPFVVPFIGLDSFNNFSRLLKKRDNVERLLRRIEDMTRKEKLAKLDGAKTE
jgi:hypothetical protein